MNLKNKPPVFVPQEYRAEIEKLSKAALMDLAWDFVAVLSADKAEAMAALRERIEIIQTHRNQEPRQ